jgi:hypothetical protein
MSTPKYATRGTSVISLDKSLATISVCERCYPEPGDDVWSIEAFAAVICDCSGDAVSNELARERAIMICNALNNAQ